MQKKEEIKIQFDHLKAQKQEDKKKKAAKRE